jgi:hypothetical protein
MKKDYNLALITLGTVILGIDYVWSFIPGLPSFFSLNRFVFLAVFAADVLFFSDKYFRSIGIYLACVLIFIGCLPFFVFKGGAVGQNTLTLLIELMGIFVYLIFFYFNCVDVKTARRIITILFLSSSLIAVYVMGIQLGLFGSTTGSWRGAVQYTSASGLFDPNILTLNFLPVFAFGPLIGVRGRNASGKMINLFVVLYICFCFVAFFHLNTRSGSLAVAAALIASLTLRFAIIPREERGGRVSAFLFFAMVLASLFYAQMQYNILGSTIAIFGETYLSTDTSFAVRIDSYKYIWNSLLNHPNMFGDSYRAFWEVTGWVGKWPHCAFVDAYIKGGVLFLATYLYLYLGSMIISFRGICTFRETDLRRCFAGFFCFLVGFMPLAITLSIDDDKLPWAIIGCVFGLAFGRRGNFAEKE